MSPIPTELLVEVTNQILDEAAFLCTELSPEPPAFPAEVLLATLPFDGPGKGEIELLVARPLAENLAETLLALDPGSPETAQNAEPALAELLNILAGALTAAWFGEAASCTLGLPTVTLVGPPKARVASPLSTGLTLVVDGGLRIDVVVTLRA